MTSSELSSVTPHDALITDWIPYFCARFQTTPTELKMLRYIEKSSEFNLA